MNTLELDNQLNALIVAGKNKEAFLKLMKGMGAMKMNQVAVRRWKNGRVIRERFYHK